MDIISTIEGGFSEAPPRVSEWRRLWRVFFSRGTVAVGFIILLLVVLLAVFAPFLAPYDPYQVGVGGDRFSGGSYPRADCRVFWRHFL